MTKLDKALTHLLFARHGSKDANKHIDEAVKLIRDVNEGTKAFIALDGRTATKQQLSA